MGQPIYVSICSTVTFCFNAGDREIDQESLSELEEGLHKTYIADIWHSLYDGDPEISNFNVTASVIADTVPINREV